MGSSIFAELERLRRLGILDDDLTLPTEDEAAGGDTASGLGLAPLAFGDDSLPTGLSPDFAALIRRPQSVEPEPEPVAAAPDVSALRTGWSYLTSPLRAAIGYTGTIVPQVLRQFDPETYERAAEELRRRERIGPEFASEAEELPALGDVLSQYVSPETRESWLGRAAGPAARIGLNILGDPTSYIGWGLIPRLAALARARGLMKAGGLAERALAGTEALGEVGAVKEAAEAALRAPGVAGKLRGVGRFGLGLPISPFAGLAYAPEVAEGIATGAGQTVEEIEAGRYAEAAASGANTLLMGGLGALVARGVISEARAVNVAKRAVDESLGVRRESEVPPEQQLSPRQILEQAQEEGRIEEVPGEPPVEAPPTAATATPPPPTPVAAPPPGGGVGMPPPPAAAVGPVPAPPGAPPPALHPVHSWLDARVGQIIKKSDLVAAGFLSKKKGKGGLEAPITELGAAGRLRYVEGKGYEVLPGEQAGVPPQAAAAPPAAPPTITPPAAPLPFPARPQPVEEARIEPLVPTEEAAVERVPGQSLAERLSQIEKLTTLGYDPDRPLAASATAAVLERNLTAPQLTELVDAALARAEAAGARKPADITAEMVPESWLRGVARKAMGRRVKNAADAERAAAQAAAPPLADQLRASIAARGGEPSAALSIEDILSQYPEATREQARQMLHEGELRQAGRLPFPQEPAAPIRTAQEPWSVNVERLLEEERTVEPVSMPLPRRPIEERALPPEIPGRPLTETAARLPPPEPAIAAAPTAESARVDRVVSDLRRYIGDVTAALRGVRRSPISLTERTPTGEEFVSVPRMPREGGPPLGLALRPEHRGDWIYNQFILDREGNERFNPAVFVRKATDVLGGRPITDPSLTTADLHHLLTQADRDPVSFGAPAPRIAEIDPTTAAIAGPRLVGFSVGDVERTGGFRYSPDSPAGNVLGIIRRSDQVFGMSSAQAEDALQNTIIRWLTDVSGAGAARTAANARAKSALLMAETERIAGELEAAGDAAGAAAKRAEAEKKKEATLRWAESRLRADDTRRRLLLSPITTPNMDDATRIKAEDAAKKELAKLLASELRFAGRKLPTTKSDGKRRTKDAFAGARSLTAILERGEKPVAGIPIPEVEMLEARGERMEDVATRAAALTAQPAAVTGTRPVAAPAPRYPISIPPRPPTLSPPAYLASISLDPTLLRPVLQSLSELRRREAFIPTARATITKLASDVGVTVSRKSNVALIDQIHNKIWAALPAETRAQVDEMFKPSAATEFLDDALVAERGPLWRAAVDRAARIGDTDARIVDLEGDGVDFTDVLRANFGTDYADALSRVVSDAAATTGLPTRFGGVTPSLLLQGARLDDAAYHNPFQMLIRAAAQVPAGLEGEARTRSLTHLAARETVDNILHELRPHRHSLATGDIDFSRDFSSLLRTSAPIYGDLVRRVEDALLPLAAKLEAALPSYRTAFEGARDRVRNTLEAAATARAGARPGEPGTLGAGPRGRAGQPVALPNRPGPAESPSGARGGGGSRLRPEGALLGGGEPPAAGVRPGAAAQRGAPAGGAGGAGGDRRGGERGVAPPSAALIELGTDLGAPAVRHARQVTDYFSRYFAEQLAKYAGDPSAADRYQLELQAALNLPPHLKSQLKTAGPKREFDIGLNLQHLDPAAMSDEQRMVTAIAVKMYEAAQKVLGDKTSRAVPYTRDQLREDMIRLLDTHTPEDFVDLAKAAKTIDSPAAMALLKTVHATFAADVDKYRALLRASEIDLATARRSGVTNAIETATADVERTKDLLNHALLRSEHALYTLLPHTTRVGRMLQALNNNFTPLSPDESFRSRFLGVMRNAKIKKEKALEFWDMFADQRALGPAANWTEFVNAFRKAIEPTKFEKFIEFWKAGLLGIPTQIVNVSTTAGHLGLRNFEQAASIPVQSLFSGMTGKPRERFIGEISARTKGGRIGLQEGFRDLASTLRDIALLKAPDPNKQFQMGTFFDEPNLRQLYGAIGGKTGEFVRIPFKLLDAFDNFFKHIIRNQEWAARANRLAHDPAHRTAGESVSHATDRIYDDVRRLAANPFGHFNLWKKPELRATIEAGRDAAIKDTFQEALAGTPIRKAAEAAREATRALPALELVQPFWKTPFNIIAEAMKRTPIAAVLAIKKYAKGEIDNPEFVESMVKSAMGTVFMVQVAHSALAGDITGGGPTDPKERELKKQTGWQPYSFKIGDEYYSYRRFAPLSILIGSAADMAEAWSRKDISSTPELMQKGIQSFTDNVMDQSFITGLDSLTKLLTDPGGAGLASLRQYEASLVPNVVGVIPVAHAARALDPTYRETQALSLSPIVAQIPGLSQTLPPQLTPTGELRQRPGTPTERLISPIMRSTEQTGPVPEAAAEIVRLGKSLEPTPLFFRVGEERVYYDEEERMAIARSVERGLREVARLIRSPAYRALPDAETPENPEARTKYDRIISILNRYRGPVTARARKTAARRFES